MRAKPQVTRQSLSEMLRGPLLFLPWPLLFLLFQVDTARLFRLFFVHVACCVLRVWVLVCGCLR